MAAEHLVEKLSEAAHEAWMETKHAQGVTSRNSEWGEDLMVPYAELSERAKDLDRGTVRGVLAAIERAGYVVAAGCCCQHRTDRRVDALHIAANAAPVIDNPYLRDDARMVAAGRRQAAEEIAVAIEAVKPSVKRFWDTADAARVYALNDAAKIARQLGAPAEPVEGSDHG